MNVTQHVPETSDILANVSTLTNATMCVSTQCCQARHGGLALYHPNSADGCLCGFPRYLNCNNQLNASEVDVYAVWLTIQIVYSIIFSLLLMLVVAILFVRIHRNAFKFNVANLSLIYSAFALIGEQLFFIGLQTQSFFKVVMTNVVYDIPMLLQLITVTTFWVDVYVRFVWSSNVTPTTKIRGPVSGNTLSVLIGCCAVFGGLVTVIRCIWIAGLSFSADIVSIMEISILILVLIVSLILLLTGIRVVMHLRRFKLTRAAMKRLVLTCISISILYPIQIGLEFVQSYIHTGQTSWSVGGWHEHVEAFTAVTVLQHMLRIFIIFTTISAVTGLNFSNAFKISKWLTSQDDALAQESSASQQQLDKHSKEEETQSTRE